METRAKHFIPGSLGRPILEVNAVKTDDEGATVFSEQAVNENRAQGRVVQEQERLLDALLTRFERRGHRVRGTPFWTAGHSRVLYSVPVLDEFLGCLAKRLAPWPHRLSEAPSDGFGSPQSPCPPTVPPKVCHWPTNCAKMALMAHIPTPEQMR